MHTILDTAETWFLEACTQLPSGELRIRVVEGIKGAQRLPVDLAGTVVGPYFPITVEPTSRTAEVRFQSALAMLTYNESYDTADPEFVAKERTFLRKVEASSFRTCLKNSTGAFELGKEPLAEWLLWTEDQVFQVLASGEPEVAELTRSPDLSLKRTETWITN